MQGLTKDINKIMKSLLLIISALYLCTSCNEFSLDKKEEETLVIENVDVLKENLVLNQIEGKWYYNNEPFSGYSLKFHSNDTLGERIGYYKGKREGVARQWSENGVLRIESFYTDNRLDKIYTTWWENGAISSRSNYVKGVKQGEEKEWYADGQISKLRKLVDGNENGLQKAWLQNGKLYVNYEAKNGRIFGMRRANSCYKLEDENIIRSKKL